MENNPTPNVLPNLSAREKAQLMADVDRTWLDSKTPQGSPDILNFLSMAFPDEAAQMMIGYLAPKDTEEIDVMDALGVTVGELTHTRAIPSGVYGVMRSGYPILLLTEEAPKGFDRATEITRVIGEMIYPGEKGSVQEFITTLQSFSQEKLLEIE